MSDDDNVERDTRAPARIVPVHGNGTLVPFTPETSREAARASVAARKGWKRIRKEGLAILKEFTPDMARLMIARAQSDDERVAAVTTGQIIDVLGLKGAGLADDDGPGALDLTGKTPEQIARIRAALAVIFAETGRGPGGGE